MAEEVSIGDYIVLQRQDYMKLHKVTTRGLVSLGRDQLDIGAAVGRPPWTTYKMEPRRGPKRNFVLTECSGAENVVVQVAASGQDNRHILDDGSSQRLSADEIRSLREQGMSAPDIVGQLVENSTTFQDKTGYSQEKYVRKKEKKYFEYVTVRRPSLRLVAQVLFKQDPNRVLGLRWDSLAQIVSASGAAAGRRILLYESGCQGLAAAALGTAVGPDGGVVLAHPGPTPQTQALLALGLMKRLVTANVQGLAMTLQQESCNRRNTTGQGDNGVETTEVCTEALDNKRVSIMKLEDCLENKTICKEGGLEESAGSDVFTSGNAGTEIEASSTKILESEEVGLEKTAATDSNGDIVHTAMETSSEKIFQSKEISSREDSEGDSCEKPKPTESPHASKRPLSDGSPGTPVKRPRREQEAADIVRAGVDALVVVCREHPSRPVELFLPWVTPSRPVVIFCPVREPLLQLYLELKSRGCVTNMRLTETWLRAHQVLPSRTHPDVMMSSNGGFLLTGTAVCRQFV